MAKTDKSKCRHWAPLSPRATQLHLLHSCLMRRAVYGGKDYVRGLQWEWTSVTTRRRLSFFVVVFPCCKVYFLFLFSVYSSLLFLEYRTQWKVSYNPEWQNWKITIPREYKSCWNFLPIDTGLWIRASDILPPSRPSIPQSSFSHWNQGCQSYALEDTKPPWPFVKFCA